MAQESFIQAGTEEAVTTPVEESFIPVQELPAPPSRVPKNIEEVAAQIAVATDDGSPFQDRMGRITNELNSNGASGSLTGILQTDYTEKLEAATKVREAAVATGSPDILLATAQETLSIEDEAVGATVQTYPLKAQDTVVQRALEAVVSSTPNASLPDIDQHIATQSRNVGIRNSLGQVQQSLSDKSSWWDITKEIARSVFVPFLDSTLTVSALNKELGSKYNVLSKDEAFVEFRNYLASIPSDQERAAIIERVAKDISSNPAVAASALHDAIQGDQSTVAFQNFLDATGLPSAVSLWNSLAKIARKGVPLRAVSKTAGDKAAGEMAARDLMSGTSVGGLSKDELINRALAAGAFPGDYDPAKLATMSAHMQGEFKANWDKLIRSVQQTLSGPNVTAEEKAIASAQIRASYMASTDKRIAHIEWGNVGDEGQHMSVFWRNSDGSDLASESAAHAWAREQGFAPGSYSVVLKNTLDGVEQAPAVFRPNRVAPKDIDTPDLTVVVKTPTATPVVTAKPLELEIPVFVSGGKPFGTTTTTEILRPKQTLPPLQTSTSLPRDLAGAKPKYSYGARQFELSFKSDVDKALYIVAQDKPSARDADYLRWLRSATGKSDDTLRAEGKLVRERIKQIAKTADANTSTIRASKADALSPAEKALRGVVSEEENAAVYKALEAPTAEELAKASRPFSRGEALFRNGKQIEVSDGIDPKIEKAFQGLTDLFRLNKRFIVVNSDELHKLSMYGVDKLRISNLREKLKRANGLYTQRDDGSHIIVLNKDHNRTFLETVTTLTHELGHAFDTEALMRMPDRVRQALWNDFAKFQAKKGGDKVAWVDFKNAFRVPTRNTLSSHIKNEADAFPITVGDVKKYPELQEPLDFSWYQEFGEYWAENFAKFALTNAKPRGVLEQWFKQHMDGIRQLFERVAKALGLNPAKASEAVESLLSDYLNNPTQWDRILAENTPNNAGGRTFASSAEGPASYLVKQERVEPLPYKAIGGFSRQDIQSMPFFAIDPKHGASELLNEARVVGVHAEAKVQKSLVDFISPYYKGLNKDSRARVRALLEEGDSFSNGGSYGKEFSYSEALGKGLSEKEAQAYLATRQLRMAMYHIRNGTMVKHLRAQGFKEIETSPGVKTLGTVVESGVPKNIYNLVTKTVETEHVPSPTTFVVKFHQPTLIDGELRRFVVSNHDTTKVRDITNALHYRPGEFSRIYTDEYFITQKTRVKVDGVWEKEPLTTTIRTARSKKEAVAFVEDMTTSVALMKLGARTDQRIAALVGKYMPVEDFVKAYDAGEWDNLVSFGEHFTRNREEYLNGSVSEALANGRLFTSKRGEKLLSTDANRQNTLGVFESLEAEITNVSRVASITEWRESAIRRWMNQFGDLLPARTGDDVADFFSAEGAKMTAGKDPKDSLFAERTHRYIMRQIGLRTNEERNYQAITRRLTERYMQDGDTVEVLGQKMRNMSVLNFVRSANFNLTLGMFNPAQLIVQANGAMTAIALAPIHGLAAVKTFPLMRMALMSDNPSVWKWFGQANKLSELGLGSVDEFVDLVKAVRQTGIIDNIKSTSLFNKEEGRLNIFSGYPSKVFGSNTFFFNRGEEFSRLVSFDVARREWKAANKGANPNSQEALAAMVVRADDLTQNMTKANLARWQEGLISIPAQFAQYNIKLMANVMGSVLGTGTGRGFTKREAIQLMAVHLVMYGAVGNLLGKWMVDEIVPEEVAEGWSADTKAYVQQGLISGLLNEVGQWVTGEKTNVALGTRLGATNYWEEVAKALFTDEKSLHEVVLGPTLGTAKRLGVVGDVVNLWYRDPDLTAKDVMEGLAKMGTEQVTTLRNVTKAYLYMQHQGKLVDSRGVAVAELTTPEILAQALGFQPTAAVDVSLLIQSKKHHSEAIKDIADNIYKVQQQIMSARIRGDHAYADEQHKLLQVLWPENMGDVFEVQRLIRDKLYPHDTRMQKMVSDYLMKGSTYKQPITVTTPERKE